MLLKKKTLTNFKDNITFILVLLAGVKKKKKLKILIKNYVQNHVIICDTGAIWTTYFEYFSIVLYVRL